MRGRPPHRKTCKRWDIPWDAHCLTFSCFQRRPFLRSPRACRWFLDAVAYAREKHRFELWAYVIMPEHVHIVLLPAEDGRISAILKSLKLPVARRCLFWVQRHAPEFLPQMEQRRPGGRISHRFWLPGGGYDRNLRSARDVHEKIRYVHENPLRRGLVERLEDWPWSSWHAHEMGEGSPIPVDVESIPVLQR